MTFLIGRNRGCAIHSAVYMCAVTVNGQEQMTNASRPTSLI